MKKANLMMFLVLMLGIVSAAQAANYTVTRTDDRNASCAASDCSLREAITAANSTGANDVIGFDSSVFASSRTITLTSGQLTVANNGTLTINGTRADRLTVSGNNASRVFEIAAGANLSLFKLSVTGGVGNFGAGIYNHGTLSLNSVTVTGNTTTNGGAGIASDAGSSSNISNSAVTNNTAAVNGGGIYFYQVATANVFNTTVSGNTAGSSGGGITNESGTLQLTNSTVTNNSSANGGGFANTNGSTTNARNALIANNNAGSAPDFSGTFSSQTFNLIGNTGGATIIGDTTGNLLNVDAKLLPLSNYGGETPTVALLPDSPAINAGTADNVPDIDQRGRSRVGATDIGAYEAAANLVVTNTANSGAGSLPAAFAAANATTADESITFAIPSNDSGCAGGVCTINLNGGLDVGAASTSGGLIVSNRTGAANLVISANQQGRTFTSNGGNLAINGVTVTGGQVGDNGRGGGIFSSGSLVVSNSAITGNAGGDGSQGGGIYNQGGMLTIANSTISNNAVVSTNSREYGGAIYNDTSGLLTITDSTISGNRSGFGGGAICNTSAVVNLTNVTISGNSAVRGAGLFNLNRGRINAVNVTITGNSTFDVSGANGGGDGGGVLSDNSSITIRNTIIAGNTSSNASDVRGPLTSRGYNLIGRRDNASNPITGDQTGNIIGTDASPIDAKLAPLGFYGGRTMTHALLSGSPAINAGTSVTAPFFDQRGASRIGNTDIGAFELSNTQNGGNFIAALPSGTLNVNYNYTLIPNTGALTYSIVSGSLPNGLTLTGGSPSSTVAVSGVPTRIGTFNFTITATYSGGSVVTNYKLTIEKANSTITINSANPNPSNAGQTITVAFTVAPQFNGTPTGNVTVSDGVNNCNATAASGQCSLALNTVGNRVLTATYDGDANFNGGVSAGLPHTVLSIVPLTLVVDRTDDDASANACTAAANDCSLRGAVNRANNNAENDTINFDSTVFASNRTITLTNGQLTIANNGTLTINGTRADRLTVSGNNVSRVFEIAAGANLSLFKLSVTGGVGNFGAGIYNHGTLSLNSVTVTGNTTTNGGAGIASDAGSSSNISNSAVTNNTAAVNGGGIYFYQVATANVFNTTVSGNIAGSSGGGITNESGTLQLTNATVANNTAAFGGGVYNFDGSTIFARNDLIAGNIAPTAPDFSGILTSQAFNLIGSNSGLTVAGSTTGDIFNVEAKLLPLSNYGGETPTVALLPDSPAINAGTADNVPDIDQRGRSRVGATDIGAYEAGTNLVVTNTLASGAGSLLDAVTAANATAADESITFAIPSNDSGCAGGVCTINLNGGLAVGAAATSGGLIVSNRTGAANLIISANQQGRAFTSNGGNLAINGVTITGGQVGTNGRGGGIFSSGSLVVSNSAITGNAGGNGSQGGGIYNQFGMLTIANSTISNNAVASGNSTSTFGGAIFNDTSGLLTITDSTISGNTSGFGGGAICNTSAVVNLTNVTISGNSAVRGAGLSNLNSGRINAVNVTITGNATFDRPGGGNGDGGGVLSDNSSITIRNTIIAGNTSSNASDVRGPLISRGYNLIGRLNSQSNPITGDQTGNIIGTDASPIDAKLAPLGFYGGRTMTHALLAGSPVINAGTSAGSTLLDQRGATRIGNTDIGAFELNSTQNGGNFIAALPSGMQNVNYNYTLVPNNGALTYSVSGGNLPNGLTLTTNPATNGAVQISGTPIVNGIFNFAITTTNGTNTNVTNYTLTVVPPIQPPSLKADVASRPNGDGLIQSNDVVQMLRFFNELDVPNNSSGEFQRADSAPRLSGGDGVINSSDVVQTIRYLNELDPLQSFGGASSVEFDGGSATANPIANRIADQESEQSAESLAPSVAPELRVESAAGSAGNQTTVNIRVDAVGNEAQYGFAVLYDPNVLTYTNFAAGTTTSGAFSCNTTATAGRLRCAIGAFSGNQAGTNPLIGEIAAGNNQILIKIIFTINAGASPNTTTALTLTSQSASDENAASITPTVTGGTISISGPTAAGISISGRVVLPNDLGLTNARVTLTDSRGISQTTVTGKFGSFKFREAVAGETYILSVASKHYTFAPQIFSPTEELSGIIFTPQ